MTENNLLSENQQLLKLDRFVVLGILISLVWKLPYFLIGFSVYIQMPLVDNFFPAILRNSVLYLTLYLTSIFCCALVFLTRRSNRLLLIKLVLSASLFLLCIHQHTYNDVTFLTCFWTSIWSLWFAVRVTRDSVEVLRNKAILFSHLIISMIFLGGAVGKMTPEYWNGSVFYEIYFAQKDFWIFNFLRDQFAAPELRVIAVWHSRAVIIAESVCAFLWILPARLASVLAVVTLFGIALASNFMLFSVLANLIALGCVGLLSVSQTAPSE